MKVISSDLSSANNNQNVIASVGSSAASLSEKTIYFTNGSTNNLDGKANTLLLNKLNEYSTLFNNINQLSANLIQSIISANNLLLTYMDGYSELDDSKIGEIRNELVIAKDRLAYLKQYTQVQNGFDEYGNTKYIKVRNGTDAEIGRIEESIYELKKLLNKLEGLAGADSNAYYIIENYEIMINKLKNQIDNLETSTYGTNAISFDELKKTINQLKKIQSDNEIFNTGLQISELYNVSNTKPLFTSYIDDKGNLQIIPLLPNNQRLWNDAIMEWLHGNELGGTKNQPFSLTGGDNFINCGCGTCVAAEIFSNLTGETITPIDILSYMYKKTDVVHKQSEDSLFKNSANDFGCHYEHIDSNVDSIVNALNNDGNVAMAVASGGHWIAITDYEKDNNGNVTFKVMDPYAKLDENGKLNEPYQKMTIEQLQNYYYNGLTGKIGAVVSITPTDSDINPKYVNLSATFNELPEHQHNNNNNKIFTT